MSYLILVYILFLIGFIIFSILGIYHLWKFGFTGDRSKLVILIYSVIGVGVIVLSFIYLGIRSLTS